MLEDRVNKEGETWRPREEYKSKATIVFDSVKRASCSATSLRGPGRSRARDKSLVILLINLGRTPLVGHRQVSDGDEGLSRRLMRAKKKEKKEKKSNNIRHGPLSSQLPANDARALLYMYDRSLW